MSAPDLTAYIQGQGSVSADQLNTFIQSCVNVVQLRTFIGTTGNTVMILGFSTANDGGGGFFYWNASGTGPDDGGVTSVVPTGADPGCWSRLTLYT